MIPDEHVYDYGLFLLDEDLHMHGLSLASFPSMPTVLHIWKNTQENPYIAEQLDYSTEDECRLLDQNLPLLNAKQHFAFDEIYNSIVSQSDTPFFLHSPGKTGKMFKYSTHCHHVCSNEWIVFCVASCGIASLLLPGSHTAHSMFSIPIKNLCEDSSCAVDKNLKLAEIFCSVHLIVWDEAVT